MATAANTTGKPEQGIKTENLFPLDAPEFAIRFRNGAKIFRHVFRHITAADWEAYYASVIVEDATEDRGVAESIYQDTASFVLYQRIILRVEGYRTRGGCAPEELANWPDCVPQSHRLFAIGLLLEDYGSIATDTFQLGADGRSVLFTIVRAEESSTTKQFFGVTHYFSRPTAHHRRRFLSARSKFPSSEKEIVSLYDELIECVDGYGIAGREIKSHAEIVREMVPPHKLYAVSALFDDCGPGQHRARAVTPSPDFVGMKKAASTPRVEVH